MLSSTIKVLNRLLDRNIQAWSDFPFPNWGGEGLYTLQRILVDHCEAADVRIHLDTKSANAVIEFTRKGNHFKLHPNGLYPLLSRNIGGYPFTQVDQYLKEQIYASIKVLPNRTFEDLYKMHQPPYNEIIFTDLDDWGNSLINQTPRRYYD